MRMYIRNILKLLLTSFDLQAWPQANKPYVKCGEMRER